MKKTTPSAPAVMSLAEIQKLPLKEACAKFAERATVSQRAFAEMGKLHFSISRNLKKGDSIYKELRKLGVRDSTISNASYASKVAALVADKHITEAQFDALGFADCFALCRAMSVKSAVRLSPKDIGLVLAESKDPAQDFDSLYETGLTAADATAKAEKEAEEERQRQIQAEAERLAAEKEAKKQATGGAQVPPAAPGKTATAQPQSPGTPAPAPGKVTPLPKKATAQDAMETIDALEIMLMEIEDEEALKPVVKRLVALTNLATEIVADNKDPQGQAGKKSTAKAA